MITPKFLAALAALALVGGSRSALAQSPQTDEVLVLHIDLQAVEQGASTTSHGVLINSVKVTHITSRDIIAELGAATGNSFSANARLELLTPTNNVEVWTVQVHDGTNFVDVTGFIGHQPGGRVVSSWVNLNTGASGGVQYSLDSFSLQDQGGFPGLSEHFNVSGFTVSDVLGQVNRRGQLLNHTISVQASVSGFGDNNGNPTVVTGTIKAVGVGTETVTPPVATGVS